MQRLHDSARLIYMEIPYSVDELTAACNELLAANGLRECYIRPIAFYGYGQLGVSARDNPVETVIMSWPWGTYLGEDALPPGSARRSRRGSASRRTSSRTPRRRPASTSTRCSPSPRRSSAGYDEAILLTPEGTVADGPGETIFVVLDGKLYTPDLSTGILNGITRDSIIQIAATSATR